MHGLLHGPRAGTTQCCSSVCTLPLHHFIVPVLGRNSGVASPKICTHCKHTPGAVSTRVPAFWFAPTSLWGSRQGQAVADQPPARHGWLPFVTQVARLLPHTYPIKLSVLSISSQTICNPFIVHDKSVNLVLFPPETLPTQIPGDS